MEFRKQYGKAFVEYINDIRALTTGSTSIKSLRQSAPPQKTSLIEFTQIDESVGSEIVIQSVKLSFSDSNGNVFSIKSEEKGTGILKCE